jgi:hypothetical protein
MVNTAKQIRELAKKYSNICVKNHALYRMLERCIPVDEIQKVLLKGKLHKISKYKIKGIKNNKTEKVYIFNLGDTRVVAGLEKEKIKIITVMKIVH